MPLSVAPRRALDQAQVQRISELITSQEQDEAPTEVAQCNIDEVTPSSEDDSLIIIFPTTTRHPR